MLTQLIAAEQVAFPGLGIGPFTLKQSAFTLFGREVRWYGILICIGMILGVLYILNRAKYEKIKSDDVIDLAIFTILFSVLGARLYYVLFELDRYIVKGDILATLGKMAAIWEGGLAIYGALIAGFITIFVVCRIKKMRFATVLDIVAPGVMIGQIIGRWGNFMNVEAYGYETDLPWRMWVSRDSLCHHPTFLYESLWNLIGFILIAIFYKKKKFNGQVFLFYMTWYGFGRMFIEGLRTDSLYLHVFGLDIRISQIVGFVTFIVGLVLMIINLIRVKKYNERTPAPAYISSFEGESYDFEGIGESPEAETEEPKGSAEDAPPEEKKAEPEEENDG